MPRQERRGLPAAGEGLDAGWIFPPARAHRRNHKARSVLPLGLANAVLGWGGWGTDRAAALVLPKTCPHACAHHSGDTRFHPFAASFDCPGRGHLVEALRSGSRSIFLYKEPSPANPKPMGLDI